MPRKTNKNPNVRTPIQAFFWAYRRRYPGNLWLALAEAFYMASLPVSPRKLWLFKLHCWCKTQDYLRHQKRIDLLRSNVDRKKKERIVKKIWK